MTREAQMTVKQNDQVMTREAQMTYKMTNNDGEAK
jgi:hypothetical protein